MNADAQCHDIKFIHIIIKYSSEGTPELDWSKIYSWNSKGTPKLVQQFTSRSTGNTKMVHQPGAGAARRSSTVGCDEVQNGSSADQVQSTSAVFKYRCINKRNVKCRSDHYAQ
ncbi:hypothetical protein F511_38394 [Dorcoceras hygrometricum]|uniref:Uncharacterized protein n=1 Tax=Dorcoceras hygrometricum TaxID=472368 RepID=A0A2Z7BGY3_9LAMI|nr:hypothetical protein F511_38394 [Dorcoceras hygrometricum]